MADPGPKPIYLRVLLHFRGNFVRHPPFEGETYLVTDMDLTAIDLVAYAEYLERFIGETVEKPFYAQHNRPLEVGIRWIEDDVDYAFFLYTTFEELEEPISLYIAHSGDGLAELYNTDSDESGAVRECDEPDPQVNLNRKNDDDFLGLLYVPAGRNDDTDKSEILRMKHAKNPLPSSITKLVGS
ncbi:hypothetical protein LXL04_004421 [Taraxacum kok-saghyz]